jgi:hypothetical protein
MYFHLGQRSRPNAQRRAPLPKYLQNTSPLAKVYKSLYSLPPLCVSNISTQPPKVPRARPFPVGDIFDFLQPS